MRLEARELRAFAASFSPADDFDTVMINRYGGAPFGFV
jgi:hypothetical protein